MSASTPNITPDRPADRPAGKIVILNGVPRSGKSSIARAIQERSEEIWINFGVDAFSEMIPERLRPGIGLRPGADREDVLTALPELLDAYFAALAAIALAGTNVVADLGIHDDHLIEIAFELRRRSALSDFKALFVGVICSREENIRRREATSYPVPDKELLDRWDTAVHGDKHYDLEIDTSCVSPEAAAALILGQLAACYS